jgi:predicted nucleic acid-binding protein
MGDKSVRIFADTSALYALLDRNDSNHHAAALLWERILSHDPELITTNYILVETIALVQNRLGIAAVNDLQEAITPLLRIEWVDRELHQIGVFTVVTTNRRPVSLVDCVSFAVCRQLGVDYVFAFDPHFWEQGFQPLSNVA